MRKTTKGYASCQNNSKHLSSWVNRGSRSTTRSYKSFGSRSCKAIPTLGKTAVLLLFCHHGDNSFTVDEAATQVSDNRMWTTSCRELVVNFFDRSREKLSPPSKKKQNIHIQTCFWTAFLIDEIMGHPLNRFQKPPRWQPAMRHLRIWINDGRTHHHSVSRALVSGSFQPN